MANLISGIRESDQAVFNLWRNPIDHKYYIRRHGSGIKERLWSHSNESEAREHFHRLITADTSSDRMPYG